MADKEVINKWVVEFFIRHNKNPRVFPTNLLSALKLGDSAGDCSNLKKAAVLRGISDSLIHAKVDEGTLDLLETLEKLLLQEGGSVRLTESHKSAYCWTAVECTVRLMWPLDASEGLYEDGLERIWTKKVRVLKESGSGLVVSEELLKWEADLRKAVEDPEAYQRIRESNVRYTAVSFLTQLLKEQWAVLGRCSSLESVAQRWLLKRKVAGKGSREGPNAVDESTRRSLDEGEKENGDDNRDVHGEEERTMGAQEREEEPSRVDKGDKMDYLLEIQRQMDASTRQVQEPNNVTPSQSSRRVIETGTSSQQQDNSSEGRVRPRLPTPVPLNVSPLKKKRASPAARRPKQFWTPEEVEVLREGVKVHGKAWKDIKKANPVVFAKRTEVDLKDKWRNLVR